MRTSLYELKMSNNKCREFHNWKERINKPKIITLLTVPEIPMNQTIFGESRKMLSKYKLWRAKNFKRIPAWNDSSEIKNMKWDTAVSQ